MYRLYLRNKLLSLRTRGVVPLTLRYQYNENVQSLRTLVPVIFMYGFCTVIGSILVICRQLRFNSTGASDILQMIYLQVIVVPKANFQTLFLGCLFVHGYFCSSRRSIYVSELCSSKTSSLFRHSTSHRFKRITNSSGHKRTFLCDTRPTSRSGQ